MADIEFECPHCQHILVVDERGAGKQVPCPECRKPVTIPVPDAAAADPAESVIQFFCQHCGKETEAEADLSGQDAFCPHCGKQFTVPSPAEDAADDQANAEEEHHQPLRLRRDDPDVQEIALRPCPYCKTPIPEDNVICLHCETDLRTGKHLATTLKKNQRVNRRSALIALTGLVAVVGTILLISSLCGSTRRKANAPDTVEDAAHALQARLDSFPTANPATADELEARLATLSEIGAQATALGAGDMTTKCTALKAALETERDAMTRQEISELEKQANELVNRGDVRGAIAMMEAYEGPFASNTAAFRQQQVVRLNGVLNDSLAALQREYAPVREAAEVLLMVLRQQGDRTRNTAALTTLTEYAKHGSNKQLRFAALGAVALSYYAALGANALYNYNIADFQRGSSAAEFLRRQAADGVPSQYIEAVDPKGCYQPCYHCHGRGKDVQYGGEMGLTAVGRSTCSFCKGSGKLLIRGAKRYECDYMLREVWALAYVNEHPDVRSFVAGIQELASSPRNRQLNKGEAVEDQAGWNMWGTGGYGAYNAMAYFISRHKDDIDLENAAESAVALGILAARSSIPDISSDSPEAEAFLSDIRKAYPNTAGSLQVEDLSNRISARNEEIAARAAESRRLRDQMLARSNGDVAAMRFATWREAFEYALFLCRKNAGGLDELMGASVGTTGGGEYQNGSRLLNRYKVGCDIDAHSYYVYPFRRDQDIAHFDWLGLYL